MKMCRCKAVYFSRTKMNIHLRPNEKNRSWGEFLRQIESEHSLTME